MRWVRVLIPVVLILAVTGSGCITWRGPEDVRRQLSREAGVQLDRDFGLTVHRPGMWLARVGMRFAGEHEISLRGVHQVRVGIYHVEGLRRGVEAAQPLDPTSLVLEGWEPIARVSEEDESVLVMVRRDDDRVRGMLVVVAEPDEWVVVKIKGKLDRILEEAIAMGFEEAGRPDLYEKSREERGLEPLDRS